MGNKGLGGKGLSDKEAALLAAARRELAKPAAAPPGANDAAQTRKITPAAPRVPRAPTRPVSTPPATLADDAAPADAPAKTDSATRMAMLMDAERRASEDRKRRIKRNYLILVSAVMVPAVLYALVSLFRLLAR
ncbi:MAG: hypothetical protein A3H35_16095 [Betaproteobacteria bacterium RIFCSPLOWO2_02_FULL_62_17]|nr:MAG: hypothetical protein A3H35_16095 [Betaproteobacteria bacterium RIFCSPLOWO2_02_FULL_62_17]